MSAAIRMRRWYWVRKWSSLICTVFLLLLCPTGRPLIFQEEMGGWLDDALSFTGHTCAAEALMLTALLAFNRWQELRRPRDKAKRI